MVLAKRSRSPKRCRKQNVFPCKGECVPRYHWKTGTEQRCRELATGNTATYLGWMAKQSPTKVPASKIFQQSDPKFSSVAPGDRQSKPTISSRYGRAKMRKLEKQNDQINLEIDAAYQEWRTPKDAGSQDAAHQKYLGLKEQKLKIREQIKGLRLQGFKDSFELAKEKEERQKQLGESRKQKAEENKQRQKVKSRLSRSMKKGELLTQKYSELKGTPLSEQMKAYQAQSDAIAEEIKQVRQKMKAAGDVHARSKNKQERAELFQEYLGVSRQYQALQSKAESLANPSIVRMENIRKNLLDNSKLSEAESLALANRIDITDDVATTFPGGIDGAKTAIADFYRLTGGKGSSGLGRVYKSENRAFAAKSDKSINIGDQSGTLQSTRTVLFHEMGHFVEFEDEGAKGQAMEWIKSKATGNAMRLNLFSEMKNYRDDEIAYPDDFADPYVGKVYTDGSTEVISVGLEHFASPKKMAELFEKDPSHFYLMMGIIGG